MLDEMKEKQQEREARMEKVGRPLPRRRALGAARV